MDYLQEVERRQRATLTRLLTGGRSGEETAAEEEQRRTAVRPGTETGRTVSVRPARGTDGSRRTPEGGDPGNNGAENGFTGDTGGTCAS